MSADLYSTWPGYLIEAAASVTALGVLHSKVWKPFRVFKARLAEAVETVMTLPPWQTEMDARTEPLKELTGNGGAHMIDTVRQTGREVVAIRDEQARLQSQLALTDLRVAEGLAKVAKQGDNRHRQNVRRLDAIQAQIDANTDSIIAKQPRKSTPQA